MSYHRLAGSMSDSNAGDTKRISDRRRRTHRAAWIGAGIAIAIVITGCGGSNTSQKPSNSQGGTLTVADSLAPLSLDPALGGFGPLGIYFQPAYEPLINVQPNGQFTPGLATSWGYSSGNHVFTLTLRKGVKFSNGEPLTAQDVVNTIDYFRKTSREAAFIATVTSVAAQGSSTVTVRMSTPNPELPDLFDQYWNLGDVIAPAGLASPGHLTSESLGAGPYVLDSAATVTNNTYVYTPNPYYYDKAAIRWHKIVIKVFTNTNSAFEALEAGQIQVMTAANSQQATSAAADSNLQVISSFNQWAGMELSDIHGIAAPALANLKVRQAIEYAINRPAITSAIFGKYGEANSQLQGTKFGGYDSSLNNYYDYNPSLAKKLLTEAGYPKGFSMAAVTGSGQETVFAEAIAAELAKVGITMSIKTDATATEYVADGESKKFSVFPEQNSMGSPYLNYLFTLGIGPSTNAILTPEPTELSQLANEASSASSSAAADAAWQKVYAYAIEQGIYVVTSWVSEAYIAAKSVSFQAPGDELSLDPVFVTPAS
jgi:peptide/nickel transport system substrate-binding protein